MSDLTFGMLKEYKVQDYGLDIFQESSERDVRFGQDGEKACQRDGAPVDSSEEPFCGSLDFLLCVLHVLGRQGKPLQDSCGNLLRSEADRPARGLPVGELICQMNDAAQRLGIGSVQKFL